VASKYAQKPGESDHAFTARLRGIGLEHLAETLPQAELAAVAASYNGAVQRIEQGGGPQTGEQLHEQLAARQTVVDRGLYDGTPQDRAALVGRWGGRVIQGQGHAMVETISSGTPLSSVEAYALARQRDAEASGQLPQRQAVPASSSGSGWLGVDNRG
jgi:hypothetical protein